MVELRRYPRVPYNRRGALHIEADGIPVMLDVRLETISCQGAGVRGEKQDVEQIETGSRVRLSVDIDQRRMQIPARVVWAKGCHLGLRLLLGSMGDDERNAYASWIVPLTNRAFVAARE